VGRSIRRSGASSRRTFITKRRVWNAEDFKKLAQRLDNLSAEKKLGREPPVYLSTPPEVYPHIVEQLGHAGLASLRRRTPWVRIIIEKPFGRDLTSAKALNKTVLCVFDEQQVYRIDHYLGKDTVQNLLVAALQQWNLRAAVESQLRRPCADHGGGNAGCGAARRIYETAGALRDMIQSHVLQLTSLVAVEPPARFDATSGAQ